MLRSYLLSRPRRVKQLFVVGIDTLTCLFAVWLAFSLRLDQWHRPHGLQWIAYALAPMLMSATFIPLGLYRAVFRYTGMVAMQTVAVAVFYFSVIYALALFALRLGGLAEGVPRSLPYITFFVLLGLIGMVRSSARVWLSDLSSSRRNGLHAQRVLIYGAGSSGVQTARAMAAAPEFALKGFIDDEANLQGRNINGLPVYAPSQLAEVLRIHKVESVVLAMPSVSRATRNQIIERLRAQPVHVMTLPGLSDLGDSRVRLSDLRELDIEDLLGRDPVEPDHSLLTANNFGKVVLVTGAGGSIGSELCRQLIRVRPRILLLVDTSEFAMYAIHRELEGLARLDAEHSVQLVPLLASVRDRDLIRKIMDAWRPDTVYHAAAYKHVPLVEHNPAQGIENNVFGTLRTALAAREFGVANFVLISTDKAVRPTNIMGASKRLAELSLQALANDEADHAARTHQGSGVSTRFSMVRFGNVLGSSGSVVPLFREQIKIGGPITLTHPDITRYFMTIPEAAQLVIQAGAMATGGDVFVLDMGEPVRIIDLASKMVELAGLSVKNEANPDGDIAVLVTGLRPGEKLYEELLIGDNPMQTSHPRIMKAREDFLTWADLRVQLDLLDAALTANDVAALRGLLQRLVSGYQAADSIVDWLHCQSRLKN